MNNHPDIRPVYRLNSPPEKSIAIYSIAYEYRRLNIFIN
jgi:hypothetical protein